MTIIFDSLISFLQTFLSLCLEAAPWLVIGLALGGLMKALIPTQFLQRHLSGAGANAILKATVLGAPLPLCSCGVIPAALGLRQAGASKPATTAFLVSTPETGLDSITVTYALMGPFMAIVRPLSALSSAIVAGSLVAIFDPEEASKQPKDNKTNILKTNQSTVNMTSTSCCGTSSNDTSNNGPTHTDLKPPVQSASPSSCCAKTTPTAAVVAPKANSSSCCTTTATDNCSSEPTQSSNGFTKAWGGIHYAFTSLLDDIIGWLVVGMLFAAASMTLLPPHFLAQWGQGLTAMLVMIAAGIPMYICATASTPVAAGLLIAGVSPGVALVFLLAGPATNISTLGLISKELGQRSMWLYLAGVGITAIMAGTLTDMVIEIYNINILTQISENHQRMPAALEWGGLLLLLITAGRKIGSKK